MELAMSLHEELPGEFCRPVESSGNCGCCFTELLYTECCFAVDGT
ncbi:uncharacterized protein METZ01_LOCUS363092 [marine metagenome]|uniref:Uncharacterized protein n=1 Tax=marine metagenome TaxID=408172 RepID=A0A382SM18_9ZZZZ